MLFWTGIAELRVACDGCWQDLQAFLTAGKTCSQSSISLLLEKPFHYSTQPFLPSLTPTALVQSIFPLRSLREHQWWLSLWMQTAVPWTSLCPLDSGTCSEVALWQLSRLDRAGREKTKQEKEIKAKKQE